MYHVTRRYRWLPMHTLKTPACLSRALLASAVAASAPGQGFGSQQVITKDVFDAWSVHAADFDGDGDADLLSQSNDEIA